ncbi:TssA family type VI secretion system protein, partial [Cedecea davisae]|uniref:TssA family type VI secretion system protein n=1 Tax=Cedecea davisae TaxID=158484 RepID=UPI00243193A3
MATAETLLTLCLPEADQRTALLAKSRESLSLWSPWLTPLPTGNGAGDDPTYEDDFQLMREEINKLSGTDTDVLCRLAESILTRHARDIRVATWYTWASLQRDGDAGLTDGVLLLAAMLEQAGQHCHPQRSTARLAALDWLNSERVLDALARWPDVTREETARTAAALCLLETALEQLPETERPMFTGLLRTLETRLAGIGGLDTPVATSGQDHAGDSTHSTPTSGAAVPETAAVKSEVELVRQLRVLSGWVVEQPQGWLAAHRMMKAARWDLVTQLPALDASGRTRLLPPKPDYRAQLKRLYLQQGWTELIEQVDVMFTEGGNRRS